MEILQCCLPTTYFQTEDDISEQRDGLSMGSSWSPLIANIYKEDFEEKLLNTSPQKPNNWVKYVDNITLVWNHDDEKLEACFHYINSIRTNIKFTIKKEENKRFTFLDQQILTTNHPKPMFIENQLIQNDKL